jgi:hypothetical protein
MKRSTDIIRDSNLGEQQRPLRPLGVNEGGASLGIRLFQFGQTFGLIALRWLIHAAPEGPKATTGGTFEYRFGRQVDLLSVYQSFKSIKFNV